MKLVWYDSEEEYNWLASVLLDNGMGYIWLGKLNNNLGRNMFTRKYCTRCNSYTKKTNVGFKCILHIGTMYK